MGMLKKAVSLHQGYDRHACGVLRHFAVLTYSMYTPLVKMATALPVEGRVLV